MHVVYDFFAQFPDWLATFLLAMLPITELRGSIPFAIGFFDMNPWLAFIISVCGDIIPAIFIIWLLEPMAAWLSERVKFFKRIFDWWFGRVNKSFAKKYAKYGEWALLLFVAIPLPITGAWTGSVAAFLFKVPRKRAILFIGGGVIISGVIVTLISIGAFSIF